MPRTTSPHDHVYAFADLQVVSAVALPELLAAPAGRSPGADRVLVRWTATAPIRDVTWFHQWDDDNSDVWARFGAMDSRYVVEFPEAGAFVISADADEVEAQLHPDVPMVTARHLLLNQVLPLVLSRRRPLVLHAGAVSIHGGVVAFVGPTGAGKSTLVAACARLGADVVADDSLVVYPETHGWRAVPSYPAVRLWESAMTEVGWAHEQMEVVAHYSEKRRVNPRTGGWRFADGQRPLTQILLLAGEDQPRRPAAVEVFSQVFRLDVRDHDEAVRLFHAVADLAAVIPVVRLETPRADRRALDVAERLMSGAALRTGTDPGIVSKHG